MWEDLFTRLNRLVAGTARCTAVCLSVTDIELHWWSVLYIQIQHKGECKTIRWYTDSYSFSPTAQSSATASFSISSSSSSKHPGETRCGSVVLMCPVSLVVFCFTAMILVSQLDAVCVQVGSSSQGSRPVMTVSGSVCVRGWWSASRWREILSVFLTFSWCIHLYR